MPLSRSLPPRVVAPVLALALLALAACGGDDDAPTVSSDATTTTSQPLSTGAPPTTIASGAVLSVTYRGGSVEGASRQRATLNQPVTVRITSDVADEVHVHGYDRRVDVPAGRPTDLTFVANVAGVFEVELERARKLLFTLEVR